jgi:hypothetical protein
MFHDKYQFIGIFLLFFLHIFRLILKKTNSHEKNYFFTFCNTICFAFWTG